MIDYDRGERKKSSSQYSSSNPQVSQSHRESHGETVGAVNPSPLTGFAAFKAWLSTLKPKDGSREIWFKYGHNRFCVGDWSEDGIFALTHTKLLDRDDSKSRVRTHTVEDGFRELRHLNEIEDGGLFYIPTQPQGLPLADCVTSTDDIPVEIDQGTFEEQSAFYQQFTQITGIEWASLITSGGKSIHGHIKAVDHLPLDQAQYVRRLMVISASSDPVTVRLHQPMRAPGGLRKEKNAEQALLSYSLARYSFKDLVAGFRKWFDHKDWAFPESFTDEWWLRFHSALKGSAKLTEHERVEKVTALLSKRLAGFEAEQDAVKAERAARAEKRINLGELGKSNLVDLVNETGDRLGADGFNWSGHNWQWAGIGARGCCPFHESASGNSAWLKPIQGGSGWGFHCTGCLDDKIVNHFTYWLYLRNGVSATYPSGKPWVELAKQYLTEHGVTIPPWEPQHRKGFGVATDAPSTSGDHTITREQWESIFNTADAADELEETQRNDNFLTRIQSIFGKAKKTKNRRERVEPIATSTEETDWVQGYIPEYKPGLELPVYVLGESAQQNLFVKEALDKGWVNLLNKSGTGAGKSHETGKLHPKDLKLPGDVRDADGNPIKPSIWYLSERSRCPSTETVEANFKPLRTRHQGEKATGEITPMGRPVTKTVIDPLYPDAGNCKFAHLFMAAGEKNIPSSEVEAASSPICQRCPHNVPGSGGDGAKCATESGAGYGFRNQRKEDMGSPRLRLNPQSAPATIPPNIVMLWEEFEQLAKPRVVTAKLQDVNAEAALLEDRDLELKLQTQQVWKALRLAMGDAPRYGTNSAQFKELPAIAEFLSSIDEAEKADLLEKLGDILLIDMDEILSGGGEGAEDSSETGGALAAVRGKITRIDTALRKRSLKLEELQFQANQIRTALETHFNIFPDQDLKMRGRKDSEESEGISNYRSLRRQELALENLITKLYAKLETLMGALYDLEEAHETAKAKGKARRRSEEQEAMRRLEATHVQSFYQVMLLLLSEESGNGEFLIDSGKITLTMPNLRIPELARGAAANLVLDATANAEVVKLQLGVDNLLVFKAYQAPANNVEIFQISGFGKCAADRRESANDRLRKLDAGILTHARAALGDQVNMAIAEHKVQRENFDAQIGFFQNSRGSNEIEGIEILNMHSLPKPNWGAIAGEYMCFSAPPFSLEQFYQMKCDAALDQTIGRPRTGRYPEKRFRFYITSEEALPFEAIQLKAEDIAEESAHNDVRVMRRIQKFLEDTWITAGEFATQKAIATALDISQSWVSKLVNRLAGGMAQLKAIITGLLSPPQTGGDDPTEDEEFVIAEMMPALSSEEMKDPLAIASELDTLIKVFGWQGWARVLKATKKSVRDAILISLLGEAITA